MLRINTRDLGEAIGEAVVRKLRKEQAREADGKFASGGGDSKEKGEENARDIAKARDIVNNSMSHTDGEVKRAEERLSNYESKGMGLR